MEGRIAVGEMLGLYWRSWRGLLVSWPGSPTPLPWRERERLLGAVWLKRFPSSTSFFCEGAPGLLGTLQKSTLFRDILNDTYLLLVSLFQGSRSRVRASVKQKAACFGMTFKERM